jgi:hypothetical protein
VQAIYEGKFFPSRVKRLAEMLPACVENSDYIFPISQPHPGPPWGGSL